jgi:DNA sulfur modification protein DndD
MSSEVALTIESISIENFRLLKKMDITLSQDSEKPITIIEGNNSLGKTTLMNAIYWCLYGREPFFLNEGLGKPRINQKVLNDTEVGNKAKASVKVSFSDYKKTTHMVTRELVCRRQNEGTIKVENKKAGGQLDSGFVIDEYITVEVLKDDGNWKVVDDLNQSVTEINRILPEDIAEFTLFNGEKLDSFFREKDQTNIRTGIERVSGISITKKSIDHWDKMEKLYKKKVRSTATGAGIQDHVRVRDEMEEKLQSHIEEQNLEEQKKKELEPKQREIMNILRNHPLELLKNLESERSSYTNLRKTLRDNKDRIHQGRVQYMKENFSPILLNKVLLDTSEVIHEAEEMGQIPPAVNLSLLREKIEEGFCICGTDLNKDTAAKGKLNSLLEEVKHSVLASTAIEGRESLRRLINLPMKSEIIENLNKFREDYNNAAKAIANNEEKISGITKQLEEHPQEEIRKLGLQLEDIDKKISKHVNRSKQIQFKIEAAQNTITVKDELIDKSQGQSLDNKRWKKKEEIARKAKESLQEVLEELLEEIKSVVEKRTEKLFKILISRGDEIKKVQIDENYKIRVIDKEEIDTLKDLSAGQTLYLALSFIAAIREVTDMNYPMVIDSPFGKIAGYERVQAAENLPSYLPQTQMTFLVTNTEYNSKVFDSATKIEYDPISSVLRKNHRLWKEFVYKKQKVSEISSVTIIEEVEFNE